MTKEDAKKYALEMWRWLRDHPTKTKNDFIEGHPEYEDMFFADCALCQYVAEASGNPTPRSMCVAYGCPLSYGVPYGCELDPESAYVAYKARPIVKAERKAAARKIIALIKAW